MSILNLFIILYLHIFLTCNNCLNTFKNCSIYFKLTRIIPLAVRYHLDNDATLQLLLESQYVHIKHIYFWPTWFINSGKLESSYRLQSRYDDSWYSKTDCRKRRSNSIIPNFIHFLHFYVHFFTLDNCLIIMNFEIMIL